MKIPFWMIAMVLFGLFILRLTDGLSNDARGMLVGLVFGILALSPLVLVLMLTADSRRRDRRYDDMYSEQRDLPRMPPVVIYNHLPPPQVNNYFPEPRVYDGASRYIVDARRERVNYGGEW